MATTNSHTATSSILAGRVASFCHDAMNSIARWNDARITRKSLSRLSARELDDIGLTFGDIDAVATRKLF